jgi:hypothetical protein
MFDMHYEYIGSMEESRTIFIVMLNVQIDLSALQNLANLEQIQKIGDQAAANLALLTHAKVQELAGQKLHSRLDMYRKALSFKQEDSGVWLIHLEAEADWIETGLKAHSMVSDLLASPKAKISATGEKYMIIPFNITSGKSGATQTTSAQQDLVQAVKQQLKQAKIPFAKIEKDASGLPLLGRLHKLDLRTPAKTHEGPGQGWGAVGSARVGATNIPFLQGASITQSLNSKGKVERSVTTFRMVKESHEGQGRWFHPGLEPVNAFQEAYEWAQEELKNNIMPGIMEEISRLSS